ncbi:hypothetical protein UFOVP1276_62 [uncultured Caudovirales phage]|uniref:C1q domain containing protein n=1 Tax=uncultured Caudovirales phage TaxID=2100421 RepID=A0A6J5S7Z1_9CAUD|nr:hypothetical protein UFOVP875_4 [uncultured Caudovirales phage]CAB4195137.1 hypothetical protein UFOVP1276_62 [uncultured Caudovirales phage]CAB4204971.1 hypothetical protein UFOVP1403_5 [uncultured Caudovirales phage]CAB5238140.1 hypothetical protein UFOVP1507_76 [uncultured Caudovirales phage]
MTAVISGTNGLLQSYDYQVLTTAFSYTFAAGTQVLVINPAGTLATGTITMPASPSDGMTITFSSSQQITALTMAGNGATINNAITLLGAKQAVSYVYRATGTTWYILGTQATQATGPAFSAYFNGSTQSISASTWTKVTMNAEDFDTNTNYDPTTNYRFTPTVAGYYQITSVVYWENGTASQAGVNLAIYKNGTLYKGVRNLVQSNGGGISTISLPILFNGSTDYVETYIYTGQAGTVFGSTNTGGGGANSNNALFNGCLIRGT